MAPPLVYHALQIVLEENIVGPGADRRILYGFIFNLAGANKFLRVAWAIQWTVNQFHG
jgi:hypothetical protein